MLSLALVLALVVLAGWHGRASALGLSIKVELTGAHEAAWPMAATGRAP